MSERPAAVRAVTFDLGDTIWHFPRRPPPEEVARELARRIEVLLTEWGLPAARAPDLQAWLRERWAAADAEADAAGGVGPDYVAVAAEGARRFGITLDRERALRLWETQNAGGRFLGRVILPGAVDTLATLRERGFRLGVVTNRGHGGPSFLEELEEYGLAGFFDTVVSSDQVGYRKPHPRIFERALDGLAVRPSEAVHVGDRPEADVAGARRAGITAVWMRGVAPPDRVPRSGEEQPHYTVRHLSELLDLAILQPDEH
jgi:HAD superfamily hydrolase (TIGR01509 family)